MSLSVLLFITNISISQVGTGSINPAAGSMLDTDNNDKGILSQRIPLSRTDDSERTTVTLTVTDASGNDPFTLFDISLEDNMNQIYRINC